MNNSLSPAQPPQISGQELLLPFEAAHLNGEYRNYFLYKRTNFFATIQAFPKLWAMGVFPPPRQNLVPRVHGLQAHQRFASILSTDAPYERARAIPNRI